MRTLLFTVLAAFLLHGCATHRKTVKIPPPKPPQKPAYKLDPNHSFAMNVLLAAGLVDKKRMEDSPVRDVPVESIEQAYHKVGKKLYVKSPTKLAMALSSIALRSAGLLYNPLGFAPALLSDIVFLFNNDVGTVDHILNKPLLIAWVPYYEQLDTRQIWTRGILLGLRDLSGSHGYRISLQDRIEFRLKNGIVPTAFGAEKYKKQVYETTPYAKIARIEGGRCWKGEIECFYYGAWKIKHVEMDPEAKRLGYPSWIKGKPLPNVHLVRFPQQIRAPEFVGGFEPAYLWVTRWPEEVLKVREEMPYSLNSNSMINDPEFPFLKLFKKASEHLPPGFFIYLPPGIPVGPGEGKTQIPLVIHQGKLHFFMFNPPKNKEGNDV